jgi:hypothetical protein
MIQALVQANGKELIVLGLTEANLQQLMAGNDAFVNLSDIGLPNLDVLVMVAPLEEDLLLRLRERYQLKIGPDTNLGKGAEHYQPDD